MLESLSAWSLSARKSGIDVNAASLFVPKAFVAMLAN